MSRSYKRVPRMGDQQHGKHRMKRLASKKVRRYGMKIEFIQDGCFYKKLSCSWDINDYKAGWYSVNDVINYFVSFCAKYPERDRNLTLERWNTDSWYRIWMK